MNTTLAQAISWLMERVDEGVQCPCCGQLAKRYHRKITAGIASVLIKMYRTVGDDWVQMTVIRSRGQDEAIARHWGLIEPHPDNKGWWKLTQSGVDFVCGKLDIAKYAVIYDNELQELDATETVSVVDCLGTKFSYEELMAGI